MKKGMEEVTPSCSSSHGKWEGLLVEREAWIFPLTLNWEGLTWGVLQSFLKQTFSTSVSDCSMASP